ncbi:MAG: hypothetical protein AB4372_31100 [Xenococcus sp. (in: cyanobacteria)]
MREEFFVALGFVPYAAIMGAAVSVLDFLSSLVNGGKSVLGLQYIGTATFKWLALWTIGTALGGFVGLLAQVLQPTVSAALVVAVTWPFLLRQITQKLQEDEPQQSDINDDVYLKE